jgi:hypothetical protein
MHKHSFVTYHACVVFQICRLAAVGMVLAVFIKFRLIVMYIYKIQQIMDRL